jgi:pyruvate-formate lyase-activating enzyme
VTVPGPDTRGLIFGLQRFSTEDGPGIRTTVFV